MKRVTLEIDLKENDAFEKEVENIIRAKVREIVRNEGLGIIRDEAGKEIERILNVNSWHKPIIEAVVEQECNSEIRKYVKEFNIRTMVEERVPKIVEEKILAFSGNLEKKIEQRIEETMTQEVIKRLKGILGSEAV